MPHYQTYFHTICSHLLLCCRHIHSAQGLVYMPLAFSSCAIRQAEKRKDLICAERRKQVYSSRDSFTPVVCSFTFLQLPATTSSVPIHMFTNLFLHFYFFLVSLLLLFHCFSLSFLFPPLSFPSLAVFSKMDVCIPRADGFVVTPCTRLAL